MGKPPRLKGDPEARRKGMVDRRLLEQRLQTRRTALTVAAGTVGPNAQPSAVTEAADFFTKWIEKATDDGVDD